MIFSKINCKNKKCKINKNMCKFWRIHAKYTYQKLKVTNIDKISYKIANKVPNIFPDYQISSHKHFIIALSNKIAKKINSQITTYKAQNSLCFVEFCAIDCTNQIILQKQVDVFKYMKETYGICVLNKKEQKIFPYLLCNYILLLICKLSNLLGMFSAEVEYGAKYNRVDTSNFSYANYYGLLKFNKNLTKILHNSNINFKKCIFIFIDKLLKIDNKLDICIRYLKFLSKKFHI